MIRSIGILLSLLISHAVVAQEGSLDTGSIRPMLVTVSPASHTKFDKWHNERIKVKTTGEARRILTQSAYSNGLLLMSMKQNDSPDTIHLLINPGPVYKWANLKVDESSEVYMRKANVNLNRITRKPLSPDRVGVMFNKVLVYLENTGFPFAEIKLDSIEISENEVSGKVVLNKGPSVIIDSLKIIGDLKVRESYIANYTGIKEGQNYSEKSIRQTRRVIEQNQFIQMYRPVEVRFDEEKTEVSLFLNAKKASRFDGIVGFLPDENTGDLLITGDVALHLENALRQGEIIDLNWRRLQTNTQDLDASMVLPFVLNSPISPDGRVKIYRRDTTFTDVFGQLGVRYIFGQNNFIRVFADRQTTNLISTGIYENTTVIPQYLDRAINSYGIGASLSRIDYLLNPSKGARLKIDAGLGNKKIIKNPSLPTFIYDSLELSSMQFKANLDAGYYLSILPRLVWHQQVLGGSLLNNQLFNNEAYRIGGLKSIRGFNEESIFATSFGILKSELRYQIDQNGYLFALFDQGWYENTSLNRIGVRRDTPYSLGVGITVGTKAGVFSLSTAVGSQQGNPLLIRATKFHFGFLSVF